ncbi:MAG: DUF4831 family protein [Bacteroidales bacterium]|nr:DUF4831 family protein [Bacteroidales bacterium]
MNKYLFSLVLLVAFFSACNSTKNLFQVQNINNLKKYTSTGLIYNLPKTKIFVEVEVLKIVQSKGPYADYTQNYLGSLKNSVTENKTEFEISNVAFHSVPIPDTLNTYVLNTTDLGLLYGFSQTKEGFLIALNSPEVVYENNNFDVFGANNQNKKSEKLTFNVLTSDKNYKVVYDTIYQEEVYDTIIRKIPILKKNVILKTTEEQAKDLADQILVLRDDRAALLVGEGDSDFLPDGDALQIMLDGIDELEKEYLSMFVGKIDTIRYTYTFSYVPDENVFYKKIILFKFSANSGVLPADNLYGTPVFIEINADNYVQNIRSFQQNQFLYQQMEKIKKNDGLVYRIPESAVLRVLYNSQIIAQKSIFVAQLGTIESLPASLFEAGDVKIEFYPELGSVKKIEIHK